MEEIFGGPSCTETVVMTDGPAPKRQRFGNQDDMVSVLLPLATRRSWIKYMDESDNVINSKLDVNPIHSQRDLIEALRKLSPTVAFSKSNVSEIKGWKLEDNCATEAMYKIFGARLCERVVLGKGAKVLISECAQGTCPHIMEEESEDPENEQDDRKEEGQQEVEGRVVENQNSRIMSA